MKSKMKVKNRIMDITKSGNFVSISIELSIATMMSSLWPVV